MKKIIILSMLVLYVIPSLSYAISCPAGTHSGTDAYGPTCITDQNVNSPNTPQSNIQTNNAVRICPYGSYLGKDNFGNQVCLDSKTNQVVSSATIGQSSGSNSVIAGIVVFIVIILIIAGIAKSRGKPKPTKYKDVARRGFTYQTKDLAKERQKGKCAICGKFPTHWEFDHINGRGDNSIGNCQGLCRDCHQDKTLKDNW